MPYPLKIAKRQIFSRILDLSDCIFDIGANTGIYSLIAGVNNKKVYAFEPVPILYERLVDNININGLINVIPINKAVSDNVGFTSLFIPDSFHLPTSASTLFGFRVAKEKIIIPTISLDSFISSENISKIDAIKIDTEATEDKVLWGSKNVIERNNPIIICEVLHNRCEEGLNLFFKNRNYYFYKISDKGLIYKKIIEGDNKNPNYLFVPESKREIFGNILTKSK